MTVLSLQMIQEFQVGRCKDQTVAQPQLWFVLVGKRLDVASKLVQEIFIPSGGARLNQIVQKMQPNKIGIHHLNRIIKECYKSLLASLHPSSYPPLFWTFSHRPRIGIGSSGTFQHGRHTRRSTGGRCGTPRSRPGKSHCHPASQRTWKQKEHSLLIFRLMPYFCSF